MSRIDASLSGQFKIGDLTVNRLGFGAMRVTGKGIWGPPANRDAALATLKRLPEIGVNFIDTADSYGPDISEELIREALHPYKGMLIATKGGLTRGGPDQWTPNGRPDYLIEQAKKSLAKLGVDFEMGIGTLILAHITFDLPYVILSVSPKLRQLDKNMHDAALDLGCSPRQAFFKVFFRKSCLES